MGTRSRVSVWCGDGDYHEDDDDDDSFSDDDDGTREAEAELLAESRAELRPRAVGDGRADDGGGSRRSPAATRASLMRLLQHWEKRWFVLPAGSTELS